MVRRKLSDAEKWQAVGMVRAGMTQRQVAERHNVSHSVKSRLMSRLNETVDDGDPIRPLREKIDC